MASTHPRRTARLLLGSLPASPLAVIPCAIAAAAFGFIACGPAFVPGPPDATTSSSSGSACSGGKVECDGACIDLATDPAHCGGCDAACSTEGGVPECVSGVCQTKACPQNRGECDGDPATVCETDLSADPANCGACAGHCGGRCAAGACIKPIQVAAGANYTCALLEDHSAWCWGKNEWGNLGNGLTQMVAQVPTAVVGLEDGIAEIATSNSSSRSHTCALLVNGDVACWGAGANGQLGDGMMQNSASPVRAELMVKARKVVTGGTHTCALTLTNGLYCWGDGSNGRIGDGGIDDVTTPSLILDQVAAASAGGAHTCVAMDNRTTLCWGNNPNGQLGNGGFQRALLPARANLDNVSALALGVDHGCATTLDPAEVWCWGRGSDYRLGNGSSFDRAEPARIGGLSEVAVLALGNKHSGVVLNDGSVVMWGSNESGQLGGDIQGPQRSPQQITIAPVTSLSLGDDHSCALTRGSDVLCWGNNADGELGDGTLVDHTTPTPVVWR